MSALRQVSTYDAFPRPRNNGEKGEEGKEREKGEEGKEPEKVDPSHLPKVRILAGTKPTTKRSVYAHVPANILVMSMKDILSVADHILSNLTKPEMKAEMTSTNADHCFLCTEADTIYFASVFVQPPVHSYFQSYISHQSGLRNDDKSHFIHQAEVSRLAEGKVSVRSDLVYFAETAAAFNAQKKDDYMCKASPKDDKKKVYFIVEYKAAKKIKYGDFNELFLRPDKPPTPHVKALIEQCGEYGVTENCNWVLLTDMCGLALMYFPDIIPGIGDEHGKVGASCRIFVTTDRNEIRRCWLGGLALGWDGGPLGGGPPGGGGPGRRPPGGGGPPGGGPPGGGPPGGGPPGGGRPSGGGPPGGGPPGGGPPGRRPPGGGGPPGGGPPGRRPPGGGGPPGGGRHPGGGGSGVDITDAMNKLDIKEK